MKKIIALTALLCAVSAPAAMAQQKVGIVDMGAVVSQHPHREAIEQKIEKEFGERIAEVRKLENDWRKLAEKGQKDAALMTQQQKTDMQRKAQQLQSDLQLKGKALQEDIDRRQSEEKQKIFMDIRSAIQTVAKQDGYDVVLEARATLFANDSVDISKQVIAIVGKGN